MCAPSQELHRDSESLRVKTPEADAIRARALACKKWVQQVTNELLRRSSSRKAAAARLSIAQVEALLVESAELQLNAPEIEQAPRSRRERPAGRRPTCARDRALQSGC